MFLSKATTTRLLKRIGRRFGQSSHQPKVIFDRLSENVRSVTLNKTEALNALDLDMIDTIQNQYYLWQKNDDVKVVCFKGAGRAFSAGGDVYKLWKAKKDAQKGKKPILLESAFRREFTLGYNLATMNATQVVIWDGLVMGGGAGISTHAPVKIATERSVFAMPQSKIGFFTDVGGGLWGLDERIRLYLGLTADTLKGEDLVRAGVANYFISSDNLEKFEEEMAKTVKGEKYKDILYDLLDKYSSPVQGKLRNYDQIQELFDDNNLFGIIHNLRMDYSDFSKHCQLLLSKVSPLSLRVNYEHIKRAHTMNLKQAYKLDFRIAQRFMEGDEFFEGVRCLLVDKDESPKWKYERAALMPQEEVDLYFESFKNTITQDLDI